MSKEYEDSEVASLGGMVSSEVGGVAGCRVQVASESSILTSFL